MPLGENIKNINYGSKEKEHATSATFLLELNYLVPNFNSSNTDPSVSQQPQSDPKA